MTKTICRSSEYPNATKISNIRSNQFFAITRLGSPKNFGGRNFWNRSKAQSSPLCFLVCCTRSWPCWLTIYSNKSAIRCMTIATWVLACLFAFSVATPSVPCPRHLPPHLNHKSPFDYFITSIIETNMVRIQSIENYKIQGITKISKYNTLNYIHIYTSHAKKPHISPHNS